jgi:hypothetical protein
MWTKRYTPDGSVFYYNATLNKSEWKPPLNSIIHEADYLQIPKERDVGMKGDTIMQER